MWNATPTNIIGYPPLGIIPSEILKAAKCLDNSEGAKRECGMPTLKLFGFSLVSFFMSLGIVSLLYFLKELNDQRG